MCLSFPELTQLTSWIPGILELIAAIMIFVMGVTMLKMDRAKAKWRVKLQRAFEGQREFPPTTQIINHAHFSRFFSDTDAGGKSGKWVLFILPLITVLREGTCVLKAPAHHQYWV